MDSKPIAKLSAGADEESEMSTNTLTSVSSIHKVDEENSSSKGVKEASVSASNLCSGSSLIEGEETVKTIKVNPSSGEDDKGRKSSAREKKRRVKVDWTPELHRQFVQAVELLGVDKAVPSRILEIMKIDCLTRHNVASHLQKYRSHQKHLLARESEATSWSRRRHSGAGNRLHLPPLQKYTKRGTDHWVVPTMGFPPVTETPLHVWGHPSADQSLMHMWYKHTTPSPYPPPTHGDPSFWYYQHQEVPAPGMPCFPPPFTHSRFPAPPFPALGVPAIPTRQTLPEPPFEFYESKDNLDEVIGDVLSKPWLPLPLGLKSPSIDSVMVELQRQGISKIPPNCA